MFRSALVGTFVLGSLIWAGSTVAVEDAEEGSSPLLTQDTFADAIKEKPHFVMFFAPWCGHCKKLSPVWQEMHELFGGYGDGSAAGQDKEEIDLDVGVARVDCTNQKELCSKHQVTGYPTLKLFKKATQEGIRYKGPRALDDLITFVQKEFGLIEEPEEEKATEEAVPKGPAEYTMDNFASSIASGHHFIKFYAPWCGHCQRLAPTWDRLADEFPDRELVTVGKVDCTLHKELCTQHGVRGYPTLLWFTDGLQVEQKYAGDRTFEGLKTFILEQVQRPTKGSLHQEDKHEEEGGVPTPPPTKSPSSVISLSGDNFQDVVNRGVTLVKYFAPWCGHCKKMAGAFEELGAQFSDHPVIKIAEVDCTQQRDLCSMQEVKGFPTIIAYRAGIRAEAYEGDRSTKDMGQFVTGLLKHDEL